LVFGLLLLRFSQENGAPQAFSKQISGSSGRPRSPTLQRQSFGEQALVEAGPKVPGDVEFQKGGHLWVYGSGSSL